MLKKAFLRVCVCVCVWVYHSIVLLTFDYVFRTRISYDTSPSSSFFAVDVRNAFHPSDDRLQAANYTYNLLTTIGAFCLVGWLVSTVLLLQY